MRAQYTFFHQGYDLLHEFDPYMRHILSQVDDLQKMADEDISSMNSRHSLVIPQHLKVSYYMCVIILYVCVVVLYILDHLNRMEHLKSHFVQWITLLCKTK